MRTEQLEEFSQRAKEADPLMVVGAGIGGVVALWLLLKLLPVLIKTAGAVSTLITVAGLIMYVREQMAKTADESA